MDSGLNRQVVEVSSVSGGSITNAFVAQRCDFSIVSAADFEKHAADLASAVTRGLVPRLPVIVGAGLLTAAVLAVVVGSWPIALPWWLDLCLVVALGLVLLLRGQLLARLVESRVLGNGRRTLASFAHSRVNHVFCATDLNSRRPMYLTTAPPHVFSPTWGSASANRAGAIRLGTAVRASAAFPGGLPPKRLNTIDLDLSITRGQYTELNQTLDPFEIGRSKPAAVYLADGGVWNNVGTDWFLRSTRDQLPGPDFGHHRARRFAVVDASAPAVAQRRIWYLALPWLAEVGSISRVLKAQSASTVTARIDAFRGRGQVASGEAESMAIVRMVERAPRFAGSTPPWPMKGWVQRRAPRSRRSRCEVDGWVWRDCNELHRVNSAVSTTLFRLSPEAGLCLLFQGYHSTRAAIGTCGATEGTSSGLADLTRLAALVRLKAVQDSKGNWCVTRRGEAPSLDVLKRLATGLGLGRAWDIEADLEMVDLVGEKMAGTLTELTRLGEQQAELDRVLAAADTAYEAGDFRQVVQIFGDYERGTERSRMTMPSLIRYSVALGRCGKPEGLAVARRAESLAGEVGQTSREVLWYGLGQAYAINGDAAAAVAALKRTEGDKRPRSVTAVLADDMFQRVSK